MKSLERRFNNIAEKNPYWGSYVSFAEAVKEQGFGRQTIRRWFQKLVEKDDYARNEKKELLTHLEELANPIEDNKK